MIFDGVFERFPKLKMGVIELGAAWLPSFMRQLEAAFEAFERHEQRLKILELRPSDYVRRQVRVVRATRLDDPEYRRVAGETGIVC